METITNDSENIKKAGYSKIIIDFLGNPENEFLTRESMASDLLQIAKSTLYKLFSLDELQQIEIDGLALRRSKYSRQLVDVDKGMLKAAKKGKAEAAKLSYQRFEGWSEKHAHEHSGPGGGKIPVESSFEISFIDSKK